METEGESLIKKNFLHCEKKTIPRWCPYAQKKCVPKEYIVLVCIYSVVSAMNTEGESLNKKNLLLYDFLLAKYGRNSNIGCISNKSKISWLPCIAVFERGQ